MQGHEDGHLQPRLPDAAHGHARSLRRAHPPDGRRQAYGRSVGIDLQQRGPSRVLDCQDRLELTTLPWAKPRYELLVLALVAVVAFSPWYGNNSQDVSRICLTSALQHGNLSNDDCLSDDVDRAYYNGHYYSDKAPGMSVLELPVVNAVHLKPIQHIFKLDR